MLISLVFEFPLGGPVFDSIVFWLIIFISGTNGLFLSRCLSKGDLLFIMNYDSDAICRTH